LRHWLCRYFAGEAPVVDFALAPRGTPFQEAVWGLLLEIPYGGLTTYGAMARRMAAKMGVKSMSAQAVGGAVGHNPISIVIPCHRVVGSNGSLTGYAGGIDRKTLLLRLEGAMM
jgi:methylated-DNA-[protein]-cysteine S-methyltransferase